MHYSDDLIEEVRSRNDIVDLISGYVKLQRQGSSYVGLCPFHNEKSPSFSVSPGKQMYYCFGCGAGGNIYTFLMEYENYTFQEALKVLAEKAGIKLPELEYSREARELADRKSQLLEVNKEAARYYYCMLRTPTGAPALAYLKGRGLRDETIQKFGLGYSDSHNQDLYQHLKRKGYKDELLKDSGLFGLDARRGMYDKFWNRVIYPIMDANSKVIGFGGRVMGEGKPKYLNSPETQIFDKSRNLYGLHVARSSRRKNIILCEGYMDVISLHQAGFTNAVASLGTALTSQQASLLKRYTKEVLIIYDSDEAGVKAALRAIPMLRAAGLHTRVVNLSPHKDPDEFMQAESLEAFEDRLEEAENSFLYEVRMLQRNYDLSDPQGRTDFFHQVAARLLEFEDEIARNSYLETLARTYHIQANLLEESVKKLALKGVGLPERKEPQETASQRRKGENGVEKAQKLMLTWLANYPELFPTLEKYLTLEDFVTPLYREVARMLKEQYEAGKVEQAQIINHFEDSQQQTAVAALFHEQIRLETEEEGRKALRDVLCNMKESSLSYRLDQQDPLDLVGMQRLMEEKKRIEELRKDI